MGDVLTIPPVEALAKEIIEKRNHELSKKIVSFPRRNPIMSDIGECDRAIVYGVTHWDQKPLHDVDLQARFDVGNLWEREIIRELEGLGYRIIMSQAPVEIKGRGGEFLATGRVDGFIQVGREKIPFEIKSLNVMVYDRIDSAEDFQKKAWLRRYIRQIQLYCFGNNMEYGLFIITDCLGHWKVIPIYLDYGECELILKRLEGVHPHIQAKTFPDRITYSEEVCGRCPFAQICLQDIIRTEAEILTDPALIEELNERESLKDASRRYKKIDDAVKLKLQNIPKGLAGDFMIIGKPSHRDEYTVKASDGWKVDIKKLADLGKGGNGQD
jgi:CRISPR/Cas system-associated exonuclease Cas4 (RecB family)